MDYSKSLLLYEDKPDYGLILKLIFTFVPLALFFTSVYLWLTGESEGSLVLLLETFFVGGIFWAVFPRSYRIYEDHFRIVLGGPFSIKIGFNHVSGVEMARALRSTMNFVTKFTVHYVVIVRRKGLSVSITPKSNELFIENAQHALAQWAKLHSDAAAN